MDDNSRTKEDLLKELEELKRRFGLSDGPGRPGPCLGSEERYGDLFENVNDLIQCISAEGRFVYVNQAWRETLGYAAEEIEKLTVFDIIDQESIEHCMDVFDRLRKGEKIDRVEAIFRAKDGSRVMLEGSISTRFTNGQLISTRGIFRDITKRKRLEEELRALSLTDDLTGLRNRRGFLTLSEQQLKVARRLMKMMVLFFIDIDGMKKINDTLGHPAGDRALTETAEVLRGSLRESDIIARIGGDEFAVFSLEGASPDVEGILSRISESINSLNSTEGRPFALSLSIGVARYSHDTSLSVEEMIAEADRAMYEQKRSKQKQSTPGLA